MSTLGLKGIEPLLRGANLEGAVVLCEAPESPERTAICYQFIREGLRNGERVLVVLARGSPETVKKGLEKMEVAVDEEIEKGSISFLTPGEEAKRGSLDARKVPVQIAAKLMDMGAAGGKRVLVTGLDVLLESLPEDQRKKFLPELTGELRARSAIAMAVLDPEGMAKPALEAVYPPFGGVLRMERDTLAEGFMIGVVAFEGVEHTGIFLPLRRFGEETVAGFAAMGGPATKECPECGFQVLPGFDVCPRCKADLKKARAASKPAGVFDYLDKLGSEAGVKAPEDEGAKADAERKKKLQDFLKSMGAVEDK